MNKFVVITISVYFFIYQTIIINSLDYTPKAIIFPNCSQSIAEAKKTIYTQSDLINDFNPALLVEKNGKIIEIKPDEEILNNITIVYNDFIFLQDEEFISLNIVNISKYNIKIHYSNFEPPSPHYNKTQNRIIIHPNSLLYGVYKIIFNITSKSETVDHLITQPLYECYFQVRPKESARIKSQIANVKSRLNIEQKMQFEVIDTFPNFVVNIQCKQEPPNFTYNSTFFTEHIINVLIPAKFANKETTVKCAASCRPGGFPDMTPKWAHAQIDYVGCDQIIEIVCTENCKPKVRLPSIKLDSHFTVKCQTNCQNKTNYKWTITKLNGDQFEFDYKTSTQYGRFDNRFYLKKYKLQTDRYQLKVVADENPCKELVKAEIVHSYLPRKIDCTLAPPFGISFETKFHIRCPEIKTKHLFHLFKFDSATGKKIKLLTGEIPSNFNFSLPSSTKNDNYWMVLRGKTEDLITRNFTGVIQPLFNKTEREDKVALRIRQLYRNLKQDLLSRAKIERQFALLNLNNLVHCIIKLNSSDEKIVESINWLKDQILNDFTKVHLEDNEDFVKVLKTISEIMNVNPNKLVPPIVFLQTQALCEKVATAKIAQLKEESAIVDINNLNDFLEHSANCMNSNSKPNLQVLAGNKPIIQQAKIVDNIEKAADYIAEDYPDYEDTDDNYVENLEYYSNATTKLVHTAMLTAKVMALTLLIGEKPLNKTKEKHDILTVKNKGKIIARTIYRSQSISIRASRDWSRSEHHFDMLISTWSKDIVWWNVNKTKPSSDILKVEFWHSTCRDRVLSFKQPVDVYFEMDHLSNASFLTSDYKKAKLVVYRIELDPGCNLELILINLQASDHLLLEITVNQFPTMADFFDNTITEVNDTKSVINYLNSYKDAVFCYVGIMYNGDEDKKVEIWFTSQICIEFSFVKYKWEKGCQVGPATNKTHLHCSCRNFSVLSGFVLPVNALKLELLNPNFEINLLVNWVIVGTTIGILSLYAILVCLLFRPFRYCIYYLCDNNKDNHYAYFIVVRTSSAYHSGTSSNIMIRIIGTLNTSAPHVLNYPDPQMRMLQRNNVDTFVLSTKSTLGELQSLNIWFDSIGFSPSYNCQDIWIYDMQTGEKWYFNINQSLDVLKDKTSLTVHATKVKKIGNWWSCNFSFCDYTHGWLFYHKEEKYLNVHRLTVLLSNVFSTLCFVMVLFGLPNLTLNDCFEQYDTFRITEYTILYGICGAFVSFIVHFTLAWLLRSMTKHDSIQESILQFAKLIQICLLTIPTSVLLIYGPWVPYYTSLQIVSATLIGLTVSAFIFENLAILIRTLLIHRQWMHNISDTFLLFLNSVELQRTRLHELFGPNLLRSHFAHLYKPLTAAEIQTKKKFALLRSAYLEEFEDLLYFLIYVILLYVLIIFNLSALSRPNNQVMFDLLNGKLTRTMQFDEIKTNLDIYNYLNRTLIQAMQNTTWYENYTHGNPALMLDMSHKYMGVARLRQHRMPANFCKAPPIMHHLNLTCLPKFQYQSSASANYSPRWQPINDTYRYYRLNAIFAYTHRNQTATIATSGKFAYYPGGGYVAYLGRTLINSYANLEQMVNKTWIDSSTRCIIIEFLTYSVSSNLFNSVRMFLEENGSGYVSTEIKVETSQMLFSKGHVGTAKYLTFFLFFAWVALLFFKQWIGAVRRVQTFKSIWFYIDLFIVLMSLVCITLSVIRTNHIRAYISELELAKHNDFIPYFTLFYMEYFLTIFAAILICMATIRLWRFLRFAQIFRMFERTITLSCRSLLCLTFSYFLLLLAFGLSGLALYGSWFVDFHSIGNCLRVLMIITFIETYLPYEDYLAYNRGSYVFISAFATIAIIIRNLFMIVLMNSYRRAQRQYEERMDFYTIQKYFREKFVRLPLALRYGWKRLRGGLDETQLVVLKSGEERYEKRSTIASCKLQRMRIITKAILRNRNGKRKRKLDFKLMAKVSKTQLGLDKRDLGGGGDTFYLLRLRKRKRFIHEGRVLLVKNAVETLLRTKVEKKVQKVKENKKVERCFGIVKNSNKVLKSTENRLDKIMKKLNNTIQKF